MLKNSDIAKAWSEGRTAKNQTMSTDGNTIKSYNLTIGITKDGKKIAFDYTRRGNAYYSQTTSKHVGEVVRVCDFMENADKKESYMN